jgi:hypothetical protein
MYYRPTSVHSRIRSHTAFISIKSSGGKGIGSGVFVSIEGKAFVFSAEHILREDITVSLGLYHPQSPIRVINRWMDRDLDIGYIELDAFQSELFQGSINAPFKPKGIFPSQIPLNETTVAISGFPCERGKAKKDRIEFEILFVALSILSYEAWPSPCKKRFDPDVTLLLPYGPKRGGDFVDQEGNPTNPTNPQGMSGAGVWLFDPNSENSEEPKYSIIGVQHSYEPFYQVLVATRIDPLIAQIQKDYGLGEGWLPPRKKKS